jgi:hypothetical protein
MGEIEHQLVEAAVQAPIAYPLTCHLGQSGDRSGSSAVGLMLSLIWGAVGGSFLA